LAFYFFPTQNQIITFGNYLAMTINKHKAKSNNRYCRSLISLLLATTSLSQITLPVFALGTGAGTSISNTATATYQDPSTGQVSNVQSNTVTITVAEVAGINLTVTGAPTENSDPQTTLDGQVEAGDTWYYNFTVTNVGNDPTTFRIPNSATVTGPGSVSGNLQYFNTTNNTWTDFTGTEYITGSIPVNGTVLVRVPVLIASGADTNDVIKVELGDTPADNEQNIDRSTDVDGGDVYTVDNADGVSGETAGAPANGTREASNFTTLTVAQVIQTKPLALAKIEKTRATTNNSGTTNSLADDTITYNLDLTVQNTDTTNNGLTPTALTGTNITLNTGAETRILVSDAIPANTDIVTVPTAPSGWEVVYTTSAVTTDANSATWVRHSATSMPTDGTVTRIGFINTSTNAAIAPSSTPAATFPITIRVESTYTSSSLQVANIAQVFGQTSGDTANKLIVDESGDQNPSNYSDTGTPFGTDANGDGLPDGSPTAGDIGDGYINDSTDLTATGTDPGNDNTGTGAEGEANVTNLTATGGTNSVLNGPSGHADAVGPTGINDDFTNKSAVTSSGISFNGTGDPSPVQFTNTVQNNGTSLNTYKIVPIAPTVLSDIPTNTTVTLTKGTTSVVYTYNGTTWTTSSTSLISITLSAGATDNYGVEINLPTGTKVSTAPDGSSTNPDDPLVGGYGVSLVAFIDADSGNDLDTTEVQNTTIDRIYFGYLQLIKKSRVLLGDGPAVPSAYQNFSIADKQAAPGNIIEYQIGYKNISETQPSGGSNNVILNANGIVITEDGATLPNTWARDNDNNGDIDSINVANTASDSTGGTITYTENGNSSNASATGVTKYVDNVTQTLAPQDSGTFNFQRKVQ
jgi:hypothetical protein